MRKRLIFWRFSGIIRRLKLPGNPIKIEGKLLDGTPLEALSSGERAARIGYLPQHPALFSGTIRENVL